MNNTAKKVVISLVTIALLILPSSGAVQAESLKDTLTEVLSRGENFEKLKETLTVIIEAAVMKVDEIMAKIDAKTGMDQQVKENALMTLEKLKNGLENYKSSVEGAADIAALQAINKEIAQFIIDNKDVIRESIRQTIVNIGEKAVEKAEQVRAGLEKVIDLIKLTCKEEADTIAELEAQHDELKTIISELTAAVKGKDVAAVKASLQELGSLSPKIAANVKRIEEKCL